MPGRKASFSWMRIRTSNLVASWLEPVLIWPASLDELAISVTVPLNLRFLKASTSSRAFCPGAIRTTSFSPMSTRASISLRSAMVMISVPTFWTVPSTRSPRRELSLLMVPASGATMVVLSSESLALSTGGFGDIHLVHRAFELRLGHIKGRLHLVEGGIRHELVPEQVLVAFELRFGFPQSGLGHASCRQRGLVARIGLVDGGDVEVRLDLHQQVALVDLLPFLDRQVDDLAADLGADLDLQDGLDFAVGHDDLGQVAPGDLLRLNGDDDLPLLEDHQRRQPHQDHRDDREDEDLSALLRLCHFS